MLQTKRNLIFLLFCLIVTMGCAEATTPAMQVATPTTETVPSLQFAAIEPPDHPGIPSCMMVEDQAEFLRFNERYLDWILANLGSPDLESVARPPFTIFDGPADTVLVAYQVAKCTNHSHPRPTYTLHVMNAAGERQQAGSTTGAPVPTDGVTQNIVWDGEKWIGLLITGRGLWLNTGAQVEVWHIAQTDAGWAKSAYILPNSPEFHWANYAYPTIELLDGDHKITGLVVADYADFPCELSAEYTPTDFTTFRQTERTFRFSTQQVYAMTHEAEGYDVNVWRDGSFQDVEDWASYCNE